jgi:hypothetical protein
MNTVAFKCINIYNRYKFISSVAASCEHIAVKQWPVKAVTTWRYDPLLFLLSQWLDNGHDNSLTLLENAHSFVSGQHVYIHRSVRSLQCVHQLHDK